jgi:hypothetical protein
VLPESWIQGGALRILLAEEPDWRLESSAKDGALFGCSQQRRGGTSPFCWQCFDLAPMDYSDASDGRHHGIADPRERVVERPSCAPSWPDRARYEGRSGALSGGGMDGMFPRQSGLQI